MRARQGKSNATHGAQNMFVIVSLLAGPVRDTDRQYISSSGAERAEVGNVSELLTDRIVFDEASNNRRL